MDKKQVIERFLTFAETKGVELGGTVVYGFALGYDEFRPMAKQDYPNLIADFLALELSQENQQ